jgi:hypothetical protein
VSRRTFVYLGIAVAGMIVAVALAMRPRTATEPALGTPSPSSSSGAGVSTASTPMSAESSLAAALASATAPQPLPVRRPAASVVELGVLTDRPEDALQTGIERTSLAARVTPDLCGDPAACDAVRATLRDESRTTLQVLDASTWSLEGADLDASAGALSPAEKASVKKLPRVVVVHVTAPTGQDQRALRAAFAATAVVAREVHGVVWDQLLARFEDARVFASHAVTAPLGASAFRRDRIELLYEPKAEGMVRVLTSGLSRWGQPDVEAAAVPTAVSARVSEVVLAAAEAIANGAATQPLVLTLDDLARARGQPYALDAGLPPSAPVEVDVVGVHPENGDPNDFMARLVPPAGEGPIGYVDLAERFFGPVLAASPGEDVLRTRRVTAQAKLAASLARWEAQKATGAKLLVLLPFPIPGDAGLESMWLEVSKVDAHTVTGKLTDDPLGATDVKRGDEVTRPRSQVEDLELRGGAP